MEDDILTTVNTSTGLQDNDSHKPLDKVESTGGIYTSWLSPLSKYYRYSPKGDRSTFDQLAEGMNYTPEKLKKGCLADCFAASVKVLEMFDNGATQ